MYQARTTLCECTESAASIASGLNWAALTEPCEEAGSFIPIQPSLATLYLYKPYLVYLSCMQIVSLIWPDHCYLLRRA